MIKDLNPTGVMNLKNAIVEQACDDYSKAFMGEHHDGVSLAECERFFESEWYTQLTGGNIDSEWLKKQVKINTLENVIQMYEWFLDEDNCGKLKFTVRIKEKEERKRKTYQYIVQPRLMEEFQKAVKKEIRQLKKERKALIESSEEE